MDIEYVTDEAAIRMTRLYDAPIDKVWEALTRPEHVKQWFGGRGFSNPVCEMDVRPGGNWHHVMRTPDGAEYPIHFVFKIVEKPSRLVWQSADFGHESTDGPPACRYDVTLVPSGERTQWILLAYFESEAGRAAAGTMGFTETLSQGCERFNAVASAL